MSGYDIGGGYDAWKTATPWDNDREISVWFECAECYAENEQSDIIVSGKSGDVDVECAECGKVNSVSYGDDEQESADEPDTANSDRNADTYTDNIAGIPNRVRNANRFRC